MLYSTNKLLRGSILVKRFTEEYKEALEIWRDSPEQLSDENRAEAVLRILEAYQNLPHRNLDLSGLKLSSSSDKVSGASSGASVIASIIEQGSAVDGGWVEIPFGGDVEIKASKSRCNVM